MRSLYRIALVLALVVVGSVRRVDADKPRVLVAIVAKRSTVKSLTKADLRRCFSGDAVVIGDDRLVPFNFQPATPERTAFDRAVLGLSPEEAGRYWVDRKIRGDSPAPRALPNASLVVRIVARFPGAIGYVPADQVTDDVRVIAIEGLEPIAFTSSPAP